MSATHKEGKELKDKDKEKEKDKDNEGLTSMRQVAAVPRGRSSWTHFIARSERPAVR